MNNSRLLIHPHGKLRVDIICKFFGVQECSATWDFDLIMGYSNFLRGIILEFWPAAGFTDTELGVLMEPEVGHGTKEVHTGVQA